jgi:hypothetical protein
MNLDNTPHGRSHATWLPSAASVQQSDVIPVPRAVLVQLLTHVLAGNRRFHTRHLGQAIQILNRILGTSS